MDDQNLNQEIAKLMAALESILPTRTLHKIKTTKPEEMHTFHFGLGLFLRNNFLIPGSKLYEEFISAGIDHKDGMSYMILVKFHDYLRRDISPKTRSKKQ